MEDPRASLQSTPETSTYRPSSESPASTAKRVPRGGAQSIPYNDLLGLPFLQGSRDPARGLSCAGVCDVFLRRMGYPEGSVPVTEEDARDVLESDDPGPWTCIGSDPALASRVGHVVLSEDECGIHSAIVVDEVRRLVLTSTPAHGVFVTRASRFPGIVGVYELSR